MPEIVNHEKASDLVSSTQINGHHPLRELCQVLHCQVELFLREEVETEELRRVQEQTKASLEIIQEALKRYSILALSFSYNGGKDCLVLLILYLACLADKKDLPWSLESIYIVPPHPFPEVDDFVISSSTKYHLSLERLARDSMKDAFAEYLHMKPDVKAIFVGTRRSDPHGTNLTSFDQTDGGWPPFMRIHPVLDWKYVDIWNFLRHLKIPYCELYDRGYTSLGGTNDTLPNPALKIKGSNSFRPAHELIQDDEERLGRDH